MASGVPEKGPKSESEMRKCNTLLEKMAGRMQAERMACEKICQQTENRSL